MNAKPFHGCCLLARVLFSVSTHEISPNVRIADPLNPRREPAADIAAARYRRKIVELRKEGFLRTGHRPPAARLPRVCRQRLQNSKRKGRTSYAAAGKAKSRSPLGDDAVQPLE